MAVTIKIRSGNDADKPSNADNAELLLATDTHKLYHGNSSGAPYAIVATPADSSVTEAKLSLADNTTGNVSTSAHGFVPKAPNNTNKRLDGTGAWVSETKRVALDITDDSTALTTGDAKRTFVVPAWLNGFNLTGVLATCTTVSSSGTPEFQVRNITDSQDMLSTKVTIDASEYTSDTAATAAVVNTSYDDVATGDRLAIDCDTAGTGCKGAVVTLYFEKP